MIDVLDTLADPTLEAHTAVVLTYELDLILYDRLVRRRLATAGATSQVVFCDATCYRRALDAVDATSRIGHAYSVTPVTRAGAFHPKAYLLLGRRRGRLIIGSGNATMGGLIRNVEIFSRFDFDADGTRPPDAAFERVMALADELARVAGPTVRSQLERARAWTPWLATPTDEDALRTVHTGDAGSAPLVRAIANAIGAAPIKRVVAVSPSFDRRLAAVAALAGLGKGIHETIVAVQPDHIDIDGDAVRRLPSTVRFTAFVDPRPSKKAPADSFAHAKVYVVQTSDADHLFLGSANLSAPALLDGNNAELLVAVGRAAPGGWIERLALAPSLKEDVRDALTERVWRGPDDDEGPSLVQLASVDWSPQEGWIVVACGDVPSGLSLAVAAGRDRADEVIAVDPRGTRVLVADRPAVATARLAWLVDAQEVAVSHPVAITWPGVAAARTGGGLDREADEALRALGLGGLLQPVLFELLDRVPDLDLLAHERGSKKRGERDDDGADEERDPASFRTDAPAEVPGLSAAGFGDDTDLEILASLIRPGAVAHATAGASVAQEFDEEGDDEWVAEEAETRARENKRAKLDGSEQASTSKRPSAARMRRAGRRLMARMDRSARKLGADATMICRPGNEAVRVSARALARHVMMTYVAVSAAERPVETSDEGEIVVVDAGPLAHYVLRLAAALSGLPAHVATDDWTARDGTLLAESLDFVVASCAWAVACIEGWYAEDDYVADGIHDAVPLFVLARLLVSLGDRVGAPDFAAAATRMPAWSVVEPGAPQAAFLRARRLADWIAQVESGLVRPPEDRDLAPGSLALVPHVGVVVFLRYAEGNAWVAIPARPKAPVGFQARVLRALVGPPVGGLLCAELESVGNVG
jgi:hypothetical protein